MLTVAGGRPSRSRAKATLENCWNEVIAAVYPEEMQQDLKKLNPNCLLNSSERPLCPDKARLTNIRCIPCSLCLVSSGFRAGKHERAVCSLLMECNRVSVTSLPGSWSCQCASMRTACSDIRDNYWTRMEGESLYRGEKVK